MPTFSKRLLWYLQRPIMYPEMARLTINKVRRLLFGQDHLAQSRARAEAWCAERAILTDEALEHLTGRKPSESLRSKFQEVFRRSEQAAAACPVQMGGAGDLDLLFHLAEYIQATKMLETGVAYGWSSLALLLSVQNRGGVLISTDLPYAGMDNDPYVGCVVPDELRGCWKLLRGADRQRLPEAIRIAGDLDLCHYDSDKSYSGRTWAYSRLWEALRSGGIFISDDIGDNMGFADFTRSVAVRPVIVYSDDRYIGILAKP